VAPTRPAVEGLGVRGRRFAGVSAYISGPIVLAYGIDLPLQRRHQNQAAVDNGLHHAGQSERNRGRQWIRFAHAGGQVIGPIEVVRFGVAVAQCARIAEPEPAGAVGGSNFIGAPASARLVVLQLGPIRPIGGAQNREAGHTSKN
jgi:hypothetical protein